MKYSGYSAKSLCFPYNIRAILSFVPLNAFYKTFFDINIHKDNIDTDLLDIAAVDDIFVVPAENAPYLTGTGNNDMSDMAGADIKFDIADVAQPHAIPAIDDFFIPKLAYTHIITL
jgi:hypothetical protein